MKYTMKHTISLFAIAIVLFASCSKQQTTQNLLKNDDMRNDIMNAISNDSTMAEEMINHLSSAGVAQKMFPVSCQALNMVMNREEFKKDTGMQNTVINNLVNLMAEDSTVCDKTCVMMNENAAIRSRLARTRP
jgi:hypothetical protein